MLWTALAFLAATIGWNVAQSCTVPPYVEISTPPFVPQSERDSLILEGRCFLGCLDNDSSTYIQNSTYELWLHVQLKSRCSLQKQVHECTQGCSAWLNLTEAQRSEETDCISYCYNNCLQACDRVRICDNGDPYDTWLPRTDCNLTCDRGHCQEGCQIANGYLIIESGDEGGSGSGASLFSLSSPPKPPEVTFLPPTQPPDPVGIYRINFHSAEPSEYLVPDIPELPITAFLLRIEDLNTSEIHYLLLTNSEDTLSLTHLTCHEVSVSFAVLNQHGISKYSPPLKIFITGDERGLQIPNPPQDFSYTLSEDMRIGFFGHMIINITWSNPSNTLYLDYYHILLMRTSLRDGSSSNQTIADNLSPSISGINSFTFQTEDSTSLQIVIQQSYDIAISSVGLNGSRTLGPITITSDDSVMTSNITDLSCARQLDQGYFSFQISWTIPELWASSVDIISNFTLFPHIVYVDGSNLRNNSHEIIHFERNHTTYVKNISEPGNFFFLPQSDSNSSYRIELVVGWNTSNSLGFLPAPYEVVCMASKLLPPPPSPVINVRVSNIIRGDNNIEVHIKWEPPATPNGELSCYQICISDSDNSSTESVTKGLCQKPWGNATATTVSGSIYTGQCLYLFMRPKNLYVYGNWTGPILLNKDVACTTDKMAMEIFTSEPSQTSSRSTTVAIVASILSVVVVGVCVCIIVAVVVLVGLRLKHRRKKYWLTES